MGATPAQVQQLRAQLARQGAKAEDDTYEIWAVNWPTWGLFLALETQWEYVSSTAFFPKGGGRSVPIRKGLPSPRIESAARLSRFPRSDWAQAYEDILTMERAVLLVDQQRRQGAA